MTLRTGIIKYYDCNVFNVYDMEAKNSRLAHHESVKADAN